MRPTLFGLSLAATAVVATASPLHAATGLGEGNGVYIAWFSLRIVLLAGLIFASVAAFKIPGTGLPEVVVVVLLAALLVPAVIAGTAQWYEIVAIIVGIGLLALEVFVIPGFGATGVAGILLIFGGVAMAFVPDPSGVVGFHLNDLRNALILLIGGMIGGIAAVGFLGKYLPNLPRAGRLVLRETNSTLLTDEPQLSVGDVGIALTDLRPGGILRVAVVGDDLPHRDISVVSDRGYVTAGTTVVIADIEGSKIIVRSDASVDASTGVTA